MGKAPHTEPVRIALIGGGPGAFIGPVHKMAAELDGRLQLVAGVFSRDAAKSLEAATRWGLDPDRAYTDYHDLLRSEAARANGAELIVIVTPNASHFEIAHAAIKCGFAVLCEKPITTTLEEAQSLEASMMANNALFSLAYTYSGYEMCRVARTLVKAGEIGRVRKVVVEYSQGWLSEPVEQSGNAQAAWRTNPAKAGAGGCIGDIGVHAFHLAEYVSGCRALRMCADLTAFVDGRTSDDDCNILLQFDGGAKGVLHASQVASGERNHLHIRVWGDQGSVEWRHDQCETLTLKSLAGPDQVFHAGASSLSEEVLTAPRLPAGHPQGYIEAFANIYTEIADAIREKRPLNPDRAPTIGDGVRAMAFIECAIQSASEAAWVKLNKAGQ